ncbi:MAG TPA: gamma-glutamyl-gamma-aminobutyrate hydrolase family protein [Solirubrobacteraceae bacterium]|nr:gamma-glutamyl-gamma-aminobutyrate hydrolase family protein [Solirubrobacteraceae bacterium]
MALSGPRADRFNNRIDPRASTPGRTAAPPAPLIVVSTSELRRGGVIQTAESEPPRHEMVLGLRYLQAIEAAGGIPVVAAPMPTDGLGSLLDRADGICLSGGPDIDPSGYGAERSCRVGPTEPQLDAFEVELVRAAEERGLPIFAICRGMQVLNVARGGTLHQHLPEVVGETIGHRQHLPGHITSHAVDVGGGSRLAEIMGAGRRQVNSFHHQGVDRLGAGLIATSTAPDGTIESVESPDHKFVIGVQWHVEGLTARPEHASLFAAFVAAAAHGRRGGLGLVQAA